LRSTFLKIDLLLSLPFKKTTMKITYQKAFLLFKKKGSYNLDKEPGSSIVFTNNPNITSILLLINTYTIVLQVIANQYSNMFIDWSRDGDDRYISKEEFFNLLRNYPAHFEWFLFNF
jgi:hypothetical protein